MTTSNPHATAQPPDSDPALANLFNRSRWQCLADRSNGTQCRAWNWDWRRRCWQCGTRRKNAAGQVRRNAATSTGLLAVSESGDK